MPRRPEIETFQVGVNIYAMVLNALVRVIEERQLWVERILSQPSGKPGERRLDLAVPDLAQGAAGALARGSLDTWQSGL